MPVLRLLKSMLPLNIFQVVLSVLRIDVDEEETPNWPCFEEALEKVFEDADKDNRLLDRKRELSALLKVRAHDHNVIVVYYVGAAPSDAA